ncbi:MAG: NAD-dependent epimerase/dehydratase family protein [Sphingobacteriales bacterium]|nr:MAG: NAD-dependent epimerase/dehydratase family protein [Sphingobacteriales bacterium]
MKKKVLVTGATGFLGSNLVVMLHNLGYDIRVIVRPGSDTSTIKDIPCEVQVGFIDKKEDVIKAVQGCEVVIHTASVTEQWGIDYETYERINITATKYIADACLQQNIGRLVYVSTANTIGPGSLQHPGTELNGFTLFKVNSPYINTKYLAQQYVIEQAECKRLNAVVVNPTFMIGPNDVKPSSGKLLLYGIGKKVLFYPPGGKNFVYIQDVCKGIISAIDRGRSGNCCLLAGENMSYKQFFGMVGKIAGEQKLMIRIPAFALKGAGLIGSLLKKLGLKNLRLTYGAARLLCLDNYYSGNRSERELGIKYAPAEQAMRDAYDWFKHNGYIK